MMYHFPHGLSTSHDVPPTTQAGKDLVDARMAQIQVLQTDKSIHMNVSLGQNHWKLSIVGERGGICKSSPRPQQSFVVKEGINRFQSGGSRPQFLSRQWVLDAQFPENLPLFPKGLLLYCCISLTKTDSAYLRSITLDNAT